MILVMYKSIGTVLDYHVSVSHYVKVWIRNGYFHRYSGPAFMNIKLNKCEYWYKLKNFKTQEKLNYYFSQEIK